MAIPGARSRSFRMAGARPSTTVAALSGGGAPVVFPWPGADVDLDFIRRQYWWNGAARTEGNFTTFTLNGATFTSQGLDCSTASANPDITVTLATLGIAVPPVAYAVAFTISSAPGTTRCYVQFDDGTNNEKCSLELLSTPQGRVVVVDGNVNQATQGLTTTGALNTRHGAATSVQLNDVKASGNGTAATADVAATMPTVTRVKLTAMVGANTFVTGVLSRLWIFSTVKTQAELDTLSTQIRDAP